MPIEKTCLDKSKISWSYHDSIKGLNLILKSFNTSYGDYKKEHKNTLSREEFDALPASELQRMVEDPVLTKFIFEDRRYKPDELVGIVKRIKEWGSTNSGEEGEYVDS